MGFRDPISMFQIKIFLFVLCFSPLVHRYVLFPISSGGIIFAETIALVVFLGSWGLITLVITFRFLLDLCSFLLEVIGT